MYFRFIQDMLRQRQLQGMLRHVKPITQSHQGIISVEDSHLLGFANNDYLGLSQHQDVLQAYTEGLSLYGAGSASSPVICGYYKEHEALEHTLAELTGQQASLLFSSGFAANQAVCQALLHPAPNMTSDVAIVADKLMHSSFVDGALAHGSQFLRFAHNDHEHAQTLLAKVSKQEVLLASEGIFSMDGDAAVTADLISLKKNMTNVWLMLDQAHAIGVVGKNGCGVSDADQYADINIVMGTFGKALGTQGAFVSGSQELVDYLRNFARHYVYSTALSPAIARATSKAIEIMKDGQLRETLSENIAMFRALATANQIPLMNSVSAIQPIVIGKNDGVITAAANLAKLGVLVSAVRSPTVAKGTERLRITLSATHSSQDIQALIDSLSIVRDKLGADIYRDQSE